MRKSLIVMLALGLFGWVAVEQARAQLLNDPPQGTVLQDERTGVTVLKVSNLATQGGVTVDFQNARAMVLPQVSPGSEAGVQGLINALTSASELGVPGVAPSHEGSGKRSPMWLGVAKVSADEDERRTPEEFGTTAHPFSTAQADLFMLATNTSYPYRASGKLFFNVGTDTFVCSASLIARGVVVTAAHCVANFGQQQFYSNWQFVPGYRNGVAPFGVWSVGGGAILTPYYDGTDPCAVSGVVCQDDVAVLLLNAQATGYPGTATGWYSYGWNGYGFTGSGLTHITQIGYPVCLDNGFLMERNDSYGYVASTLSSNTIIGSLMCGGSSGGPWLVNFGIRPTMPGTTPGAYSDPNVVVGVTSWGYISSSPKEQGASPFTDGNIVPLVTAVCTAAPAACS
jgi:Trypsin